MRFRGGGGVGGSKGRVRGDGTFRIDGVDAGARLIRADQVTAPWSLERVISTAGTSPTSRHISPTAVALGAGERRARDLRAAAPFPDFR